MILGRVRPIVCWSSATRAGGGIRALARWLLASLALAGGCGLAPLPRGGQSYGSTNDGVLLSGTGLSARGPGFVRAKPGDDTRFGSDVLVALLERSARAVQRAYPGTAPLYVGDLSAPHGGRHGKHGSHRTGRDVDLLFYLSDPQGRSVRGSGFFGFDARGAGFVREAGAPVSGLAFFDVARNWALVRALLLDVEAPVQWIFCADGIKARLLAYARAHEPDPAVLLRAAYVVHQPSRGNPHRDHFHVRIACTAAERAAGCVELGPVWPWTRNEHEKPSWEGRGVDDATLLRELLEERSGVAGLAQQ